MHTIATSGASTPSFALREHSAQALGVLFARAFGGAPGGERLEHGTRLEDLDRLVLADHPHARAAVARVLDQAFLGEPRERGPQRRAAGAQRLAEIGRASCRERVYSNV